MKAIDIEKIYAEGDDAAVVYKISMAEPIGSFRAVSTLSFKDGLLVRQEAFFDARAFEKVT